MVNGERRGGLLTTAHNYWLTVRCYLVGARIAWVSSASALIGLFLFLYAAPAQDILLEIKGDPLTDLGFWALFYLIVILAWTLPVYISSRWLLRHFEEGSNRYPNIEAIPTTVSRSLPAILASACFAALLAGQLMALRNAPTVGDEIRQEVYSNLQRDAAACKTITDASCAAKIKQFKIVRLSADLSDTFDSQINVPFAVYGIAVLGVMWLYGIPLLLKRLPPRTARAIAIAAALVLAAALAKFYVDVHAPALSIITDYVPQKWVSPSLTIVGALSAAVAAFLVWRGSSRLLLWLVAFCAVPAVVLVGLALFGVIQVELGSALSLVHLYLLPFVTACAGFLTWWGLRPRQKSKLSLIGRLFLRSPVPGDSTDELRAATKKLINPIFYILLVITGTSIVVLIAIHPLVATEYFHRGLLLPIVLGLPVAVGSYLSYWSARIRAPLILLTVVCMAGASVFTDWVWGDFHSVRTVPTTIARPTFKASVEHWARANECDLATTEKAPKRACPPPIIIAAAGGASRAAFHVAGVVGQLMDGRRFAPIRGHTGLVYTPSFSSDGQYIATASTDGRAIVWNAETGVRVREFKGHVGSVHSAAFNIDGSQIVTASYDRTARIWDLQSGEELRKLEAHSGPVLAAAFSPDGKRVVTASGDKTARVWDAGSGKLIATITGHAGSVRSAAFDNLGQRVVTGSEDKTVRVWDIPASSDKEVTLFNHSLLKQKAPEAAVYAVAFSPDGARVAAGLSDGSARLWNVASGKQIAVLRGHSGIVHGVAFDPSGKRVVTASWDHTTKVFDVTTVDDAKEGEQLTSSVTLKGHTSDVNGAAFSPDGAKIVTASDDRTARLWDASSGRRKAWSGGSNLRPLHRQLFAISAVSGGALGAAMVYAALADSQQKTSTAQTIDSDRELMPPCNVSGLRDPNWFASEIRGARIEPLDPRESWKDCLQLLVAGDFLSPVFVGMVSRDWLPLPFAVRGDRAERLEEAWEARYARLTSDAGKTASISQLLKQSTLAKSLAEIRTTTLAHDDRNWLPILLLNGTSVEDGRRIITTDVDTLMRGENASDMGIVKHRIFRDAHDFHDLFSSHAAGGHKKAVIGAAFSPDGSQILTTSDDRTARLWDVRTGKELAVFSGHKHSVYGGSISPRGDLIATASWDHTVRIWQGAPSYSEIRRLKGHAKDVNSVAFSPDGALVVTASDDGTARIWETATGIEKGVIRGHSGIVFDAQFDNTGRRVVTASWDSTARIWDISDPSQPKEVRRVRHGDDVRSAKFNRQGNLIVTASKDKTARVWDAYDQTREPVASLVGHQQLVFSAAFDPEGTRVVTGSWDDTARVWDALTGRPLFTLKGHSRDVNTAAFSPDGKLIATVSDDQTARIWDAQTGAPVHVLQAWSNATPCAECEIRLSTAVTMSARFPIISPTGSVLDPRGGTQTIARVVDGGYHENFGATPAMELAKALKEFGLDPLVVLVNNEPTISGMDCVMPGSSLKYARPPSGQWFSTVTTPLEAFVGTRTARGSLAAVTLCLDLKEAQNESAMLKGDRFVFVTVGVDPEEPQKSLSASWWMSKRVQKYLDEQLTSKNLINSRAFSKINAMRH